MAAGDPALKGGSFCRHPTRADRDIRNTTTLTRSRQPLSDRPYRRKLYQWTRVLRVLVLLTHRSPIFVSFAAMTSRKRCGGRLSWSSALRSMSSDWPTAREKEASVVFLSCGWCCFTSLLVSFVVILVQARICRQLWTGEPCYAVTDMLMAVTGNAGAHGSICWRVQQPSRRTRHGRYGEGSEHASVVTFACRHHRSSSQGTDTRGGISHLRLALLPRLLHGPLPGEGVPSALSTSRLFRLQYLPLQRPLTSRSTGPLTFRDCQAYISSTTAGLLEY